MSRYDPTLPVRVAIVAAGATLILGIVGAVHVALREDAPELPHREAVEVTFVGMPPRAQRLAVVYRWREAGQVQSGKGAYGAQPGTWVLPAEIRTRAVTMQAVDDGEEPPRVLGTWRVHVPEEGGVRVRWPVRPRPQPR